MEKKNKARSKKRLFIQILLIILFLTALSALIVLLYKNNQSNRPNFWNEVLSIVASLLMSSMSLCWGAIQAKDRAREKAREEARRKIETEVAKKLMRDFDKLQKAFEGRERRRGISSQSIHSRERSLLNETKGTINSSQDCRDREKIDFLFDTGVINERQYRTLHNEPSRKT